VTQAQVKCLVRVSDWAVKYGNLTGLLVTGLSPRGGELIENYVKRSGDVQTAALLGVLAQPKGFADGRGLRWLDLYRDMMDTWCLHIQVICSLLHLSFSTHFGPFWLMHLVCSSARTNPPFAALRVGYCNYCLHSSFHKICYFCRAAVRLALQLLQSCHHQVADGGSSDPQSLRTSRPHSKYDLDFSVALFWTCATFFPGSLY
jgi:hypothetical protein